MIYGINYFPEMTGIGKYTGEMAAFMAAEGHEVEVITAPPYYPKWVVADEYKGRGWVEERIAGVTVRRAPLYVPTSVTGARRIVHELSFVLASLRYWVFSYLRRYDLIICVSPPFYLGLPALVHKMVYGTPVVSHVQDLQVDAARQLKIIKGEVLLRVLEVFEQFLLRRMDRVSTISTGMLDRLRLKGVGAEKLLLFPNWVDEKVIYPLPREQSLRKEWGFEEDDRVILYAGNLGVKQGLGYLLSLAEDFKHREEVHFVIVGDGGKKEELIRDVATRSLTNVQFKPLQPLAKLAACLAAADVHLVLQLKAAADLVMPSKLTNILAVGGHALITADVGSTLYEVVYEHKLGTLVPAEDASALAEGLRRVLSKEGVADAVGAKEFAAKNLNKQNILTDYLHQLKRIRGV